MGNRHRIKKADNGGVLYRVRGDAHPHAKLTRSDVELIRALRDGGMTLRAIAEKFEVTNSTIHFCVTFKTWCH